MASFFLFIFFFNLVSLYNDSFQTRMSQLYFQTTEQAHCNPSKNPNPTGTNRYVWGFFFMLKKEQKTGKDCFSTNYWTKEN